MRRLPPRLALALALALAPAGGCKRADPPPPAPVIDDPLAWALPEAEWAALWRRPTLARDLSDLALAHFAGVPGVDEAARRLRALRWGPARPGEAQFGPGLDLAAGVALFGAAGGGRLVIGAEDLARALPSLAATLSAAGLPAHADGDQLTVGPYRLGCALRPPFAICDTGPVPERAPGRPPWAKVAPTADGALRLAGPILAETPFAAIELSLQENGTPLQIEASLRPEAVGPWAALLSATEGPSVGVGLVDEASGLVLKLGLDGPALFSALGPWIRAAPPALREPLATLEAAWTGDLSLSFDGSLAHPVLGIGLRDPGQGEALLAAALSLLDAPAPIQDGPRAGLRALSLALPGLEAPARLSLATVGDTLVLALSPADVERRLRRRVRPAELGPLALKGTHGLRLTHPLGGLTSAWLGELLATGPAQDAVILLASAAALRGPLSLELVPHPHGLRLTARWPLLLAATGRSEFLQALRLELSGDRLEAQRALIALAAAQPDQPYGVEARRRLTADAPGLLTLVSLALGARLWDHRSPQEAAVETRLPPP